MVPWGFNRTKKEKINYASLASDKFAALQIHSRGITTKRVARLFPLNSIFLFSLNIHLISRYDSLE